MHFLYSGKFSRGPIFTGFVDDHQLRKLNLRNKLDCTVHNGSECVRPRKLNGKLRSTIHEN